MSHPLYRVHAMAKLLLYTTSTSPKEAVFQGTFAPRLVAPQLCLPPLVSQVASNRDVPDLRGQSSSSMLVLQMYAAVEIHVQERNEVWLGRPKCATVWPVFWMKTSKDIGENFES